MKRYQSTLTKMTRPVCMALAALLMVGAMASCSENENTETAQSDNAYLSLSFSTGTGSCSSATVSGMNRSYITDLLLSLYIKWNWAVISAGEFLYMVR